MGSTLQTNQTTGTTTKQRKTKNAKVITTTTETPSSEPQSFVSGIFSPAHLPKWIPALISPVEKSEEVSIADPVSPKTTPAATDELEWYPADAIGSIHDSEESLKLKRKQARIATSTHASVVELVMGFLIILCLVYPGVVGQWPVVPKLLYEAFDPFLL